MANERERGRMPAHPPGVGDPLRVEKCLQLPIRGEHSRVPDDRLWLADRRAGNDSFRQGVDDAHPHEHERAGEDESGGQRERPRELPANGVSERDGYAPSVA